MNILLTTLNSKFIHTNPAVYYIEKSLEPIVKKYHFLKVNKEEFTINNSQDYIYGEILAGKYHVVAFSCYIWNIEKILHLCSMIKKARPETIIILGGPEVSYGPDEIGEKGCVDYIICGEGEKAIPELIVNLIEKNRFYTEKKYTIIYSQPVDTESIPFPYDSIVNDRIIYYESSRGCPYNCSYCMSSIDKKVRSLPMERVLKELEYFLKNNVKQVKFIDRTFNYDNERSVKIFRYLIDNDNGVTNFHFEICAENLSDETVDLIGKARKGLFQFEIGIQSTNKKTLEAVDRSAEVDLLMKRARQLVELNNSHIHVDLIAGLPYEDIQSFRESFNKVYALEADALQLGFLKLLKGTKIRDEAEKHMYVYDDKAPYQIISNRYLSAGDIVLLKRVESILDDYYNKGGFKRILKEICCDMKDAFGFYENFSEYYYKSGYQKAAHKKETNYRILNEYIEKEFSSDANKMEKYKRLLVEDMEERMNPEAVKRFYKKGWQM